MKAVMSLWTGTPEFHLNRRAAMFFSAAAAYTNRAWEQTELVTDGVGLRIAERLGWGFCHTVLALDDFTPPHAAHVFALGKIHAQSIQTGPHAHIDFDVFTIHLPPRRWREARVGYQSTDEPDGYRRPEREAVMKLCAVGRGAPVNTGLVCWNDLGLRDEYIARANKAAYSAARVCGDGLAISLVAEQAVLGALLREKAVRGEALIPLASLSAREDFEDCPFIHFWAGSKRNAERAKAAEARFRLDFPVKHQEFERGFALLVKAGIAKHA